MQEQQMGEISKKKFSVTNYWCRFVSQFEAKFSPDFLNHFLSVNSNFGYLQIFSGKKIQV
jgi:hypothetical protein